MRWTILVATLAALCAAASVPAQVVKGKDHAVASDRLPTLGTVGDLPPEKERLVLEVDARGRVTVGGAALDLDGLRKLLRERADGSREETGLKVSNLHVVIRVDRDLPWQGAQWLMQECASPSIRVYRILFAARPEDGGDEGAVAAFLPVDPGIASTDSRRVVEFPSKATVHLRYRPDGDDGRATDVSPRFRDLVARDSRLTGEIDAAPATPTGTVLETLDVILRAGVRRVVFAGTTLQGGTSLERAIADLPVPDGKLAISVLDKRVPRSKEPVVLAPVARVKGALAGITEPAIEDPAAPAPGEEPPAKNPK